MINVAIVGPGLVGEALIKMISNYSASSRGIDTPIRLLAVTNSRKMVVDPPSKPANLESWKASMLSESSPADLGKFTDLVSEHGPSSKTIIVDCTSNESIASNYPSWLEKGFNVATPNKKAFSSDISLWNKINSAAKNCPSKPLILHEATVGAGLPVLSTLNNLVLAGDRIDKVEGILSGTLSFLFCEFSNGSSSGKSFSDIVKIAKANGFTEPDPRDDLSGLDVARKAIILARLSGVPIELSDLTLENIVPEELRSTATVDEFMDRLPEFDNHFSNLNQTAFKNGEVLRYVASIDLANSKYSVSLKSFPKSHAFASLSSGDNIISFTTKFFSNPLTIMGAGAGAEVTAFGIFSDILHIASVKQ
ncbi:Bifunctional aspartokinase/homoserine dehydrogenase 1, chloroplastic [Smittium mucronatum]|uniref:Homoserine dehydrogenase n=1 Tax=Smittium mucronatum TaxID=133383 RepID=A0A1R0H2L3_9FUNG|nr:Bifunctional aspartokinase/homoserine dehydrogenase 1, chloroplastic [Smittium mucronatum]